eukprot:TRINITY_DN5623_c0_g2_i3.p1 TRINITY_DN5623_c0_g2~~TRINITY_DN5623_c0_g2_i3.p1  ORF type:complete len:193 (-),score=38.11 TRINITY_DN5623_c0_g2_i3:142-720(-)
MVDTCQAATMHSKLYSANTIAIGSALLRENAYSHHLDHLIGVAVIDRFSYFTFEFLEKIGMDSNKTILDLFSYYDPSLLKAHPLWRTDLYPRDISTVLLTDFFGSVSPVEVAVDVYPLSPTLPKEGTKSLPTSPPSPPKDGFFANSDDEKVGSYDFSNPNVLQTRTDVLSPLAFFLGCFVMLGSVAFLDSIF